MLPVNPPSPAFRGVRGLRLMQSRAAGGLAPSLGLRSRPSSDKPQAGRRVRRIWRERARGSRAATRLLCVCERVRLRDLWLLADKTRGSYLSSVRFFVLVVLPACPELRRYKAFVVVFKYCLNRLLIGSNARSAGPEHITS